MSNYPTEPESSTGRFIVLGIISIIISAIVTGALASKHQSHNMPLSTFLIIFALIGAVSWVVLCTFFGRRRDRS